MKKIMTLSKLAKECNCSTATVSYVLNGRTDMRISEKTRQKVLQMANLFQYQINPYAKSLATGESHNVLFYYEYSNFSLEKSDILTFLNNLSSFLKKYAYNVIVAPLNCVQKYGYVDAIITYKISKKSFTEISNLNFIPVISVDTIIDDSIFFEITNTFNNLIKSNEIIYLSTSYNDEEMNNRLKNKVNVKFINSFKDLTNIIKNYKQEQLICLNQEVYNYLYDYNLNVKYHAIHTDKMFEAILHAIKDSIARNDNAIHKIQI